MSQGKAPGLHGVHKLHLCLAPAQLISFTGEADTNQWHNSNPRAVTQPQQGLPGWVVRAAAFAGVSSSRHPRAFRRELNFIPLAYLCTAARAIGWLCPWKRWPNGFFVIVCHSLLTFSFGKEQETWMACQQEWVPWVFLCPPFLLQRSQPGH